ncbi:MAG TPA: SDR family oxidoreductase [Leucothrix sp.]|nr:SDR family oxidoreductase [Leucothrix sp.]
MNKETAVIFGATSAVGQALSKIHAENGGSLILIGRNTDRLETTAADLRTRGAPQVDFLVSDLDDFNAHETLMQQINEKSSDIAKYYFFYGTLPDQKACEESWEVAHKALTTNFLSAASLLTLIANKVEKETKDKANRGIVVVTSVAGDRGRQSNYVYGAAKGGLTLFLQGLRNRLHKTGCSVTTVKPGFIDTPMTSDIEKGGPLWATPEKVAGDIYKAAQKGKNEIYTPNFWMPIMMIIKNIPETIFKKLSL